MERSELLFIIGFAAFCIIFLLVLYVKMEVKRRYTKKIFNAEYFFGDLRNLLKTELKNDPNFKKIQSAYDQSQNFLKKLQVIKISDYYRAFEIFKTNLPRCYENIAFDMESLDKIQYIAIYKDQKSDCERCLLKVVCSQNKNHT